MEAAAGRLWQLPRALVERTAADERRRTYAIAIAAVVVLAIAHRVGLGPPLFPVDDAYITLHNAEALLSGGDSNFIGTNPLIGATSAVHLALTALLSIPAGASTGLYLAVWVGALVYATGIVRLAFAWGARPWQALLLMAVGLLVARMPHQILNGLETGLALGVTTWALALASERGRERPLAVLCGLMPFVRPELGALAIGLLALKAWPLWREDRRRDIGVMLAFAAAGAAPWMLWALIATGSPLPSTAGAKIYFFAERHLPRSMKADRVVDAVRDFGSNLGVVVLAGLALVRLPVGRVVLGFALVLVAFYYRELPGALNHYEHRYLYVLVPGILLGLAWAFGRSRVASVVALVLALAALGQVASNWHDRWGYYLATREFTRVDLGATADWVNENVPPGSKLLVHDAGYIAANTDFRLVDMVGLKTPRAVRFHEDITFGSVGVLRGEAVHQLALQERPDYLIALAGWNWVYRITDSLRAHGWEVKPVSRSAYTIYSLEPPPPGWKPPPPPRPGPRPRAAAPAPGA